MIGFENTVKAPQNYQNKILALAEYNFADFVISFGYPFIWTINGNLFQNTETFNLEISPCESSIGKRIDIAYLNENNAIQIITGQESDSVAVEPILPENTLFLCSWTVGRETIKTNALPTVGTSIGFQKTVEAGRTYIGSQYTTVFGEGGDITIFLNSNPNVFTTISGNGEIVMADVDGNYATYNAGVLQIGNGSNRGFTFNGNNSEFSILSNFGYNYFCLNDEESVLGNKFFKIPVLSGTLSTLENLTSLPPIEIQDWNGEAFTDLTSALNYISIFNFPKPIYSFYNSNSKTFFIWYTNSYLEDIFVGVDNNTTFGFGFNSHITIQDKSGFIYGFAGNAFQNNFIHEFSKPNILKVGVFADENALKNSNTDFIIEQNYVTGNYFAQQATGNIQVGMGQYTGTGSFDTYTSTKGSKVTFKKLVECGAEFFKSYKGRVDILQLEDSVDFDSNSFLTGDKVSIHLPYSLREDDGNYLQVIDNITHSDSKIIRE